MQPDLRASISQGLTYRLDARKQRTEPNTRPATLAGVASHSAPTIEVVPCYWVSPASRFPRDVRQGVECRQPDSPYD